MLTITLTHRNRDLTIVKSCLQSLQEQTNTSFKVILVDYGSTPDYREPLEVLCASLDFVKYVYVNTVGQLWNKSRAINIALQQCVTPYFLMGDIDLMYHPKMVNMCSKLMEQHDVVYFQYGFLDENETKKRGSFKDYNIDFLGNDQVTGTTLYKTEVLKSINGYDEFYHGWGAEDTDVHLRLKNAGYEVHFYNEEVLVKHQWHPKAYRSKASVFPFHTTLEQINHQYMLQRNKLGATKANENRSWGVLPENNQDPLTIAGFEELTLNNEVGAIGAFLVGVFPQLKCPLRLQIQTVPKKMLLKQAIKQRLGKKARRYYNLETLNNKCLEAIIAHHPLASYHFKTHWEKQCITMSIIPYESN